MNDLLPAADGAGEDVSAENLLGARPEAPTPGDNPAAQMAPAESDEDEED